MTSAGQGLVETDVDVDTGYWVYAVVSADTEIPAGLSGVDGSSLQKVTAYMQRLDSIGLPPERIAEVIYDALTLPKPKVRYQIAPDPMRHLLAGVLPKRMVDKIIAKRVGLMPQA